MSNDDEWVEIPLTGRSLDKLVRETAADRASAQRAAKRKVQHEVEMLALEFSKIMLEKSIADALDPATDPRLRRDLRNDILNRGIGRVPEAENPDRKKQPGDAPGAANILEALAAISAGQAIVEAARRPQLGHTRDEPIERDITPAIDADFETLMNDIEGEKP